MPTAATSAYQTATSLSVIPFSRIRNSVVKLPMPYVIICVAPLPSAASTSVFREKNARRVSANPDFATGAAVASKRPRAGSRTNRRTAAAVKIPTMPIVMKA